MQRCKNNGVPDLLCKVFPKKSNNSFKNTSQTWTADTAAPISSPSVLLHDLQSTSAAVEFSVASGHKLWSHYSRSLLTKQTLFGFKREVWTQRRIWTDLTQTCTRQNNSRSVYFKAAIFLRSYLPPGRLQLSFQPRLVLAKVLELLCRFISELSVLQAEMGFWGSRIKTDLWFCQDLLPLNPTDHNVMVWPVNHDGLTGIFLLDGSAGALSLVCRYVSLSFTVQIVKVIVFGLDK